MARFALIIQKPVSKVMGPGCLSVSQNGEASFFEGDAGEGSRCLAELVRARIDWAAADGILVSGMEPDGCDRSGRPKYKYQEWLLRYID